MNALRLSPIHDRLQSLSGSWQEINQMPLLFYRPDQAALAERLGMADLTCLTRWGVKGTAAADWLTAQGIVPPDRPNTWQPLSSGGLIARLGISEFLVEDGLQSAIAPRLAQVCQPPPRVYPVLRQDAAIALCGTAVNELLRQTCSINFAALALSEHPVILTAMVGVAVTVIPQSQAGQPVYRIWCDGTFGAYLWHTLLEIAAELGGGAIGAGWFLES